MERLCIQRTVSYLSTSLQTTMCVSITCIVYRALGALQLLHKCTHFPPSPLLMPLFQNTQTPPFCNVLFFRQFTVKLIRLQLFSEYIPVLQVCPGHLDYTWLFPKSPSATHLQPWLCVMSFSELFYVYLQILGSPYCSLDADYIDFFSLISFAKASS